MFLSTMGRDSNGGDDVSPILEAHVRRFAGLLCHVRRRHGLAPGDLDELVQEVRLRLWRAQRSPEKISAVSPSYVYLTAMSAALDLIRRRRRESRAVTQPAWLEGPASATPWSDRDPADVLDLSRKLEEAITALHPTREVAVRLHLAGYPREEIGALMEWSEAKTRNLVYRGMADLRNRLAELGVGPEGAR
jgi:RNA polymerase sigma factor (sigma-70 family)